MNAIVPFPKTTSLTMSSQEIAELTGKEHKNVIRDIRVMIDELGDGSDLSHVQEAKDARGYTTEFLLPKDLTLTLVTGYDVKRRHAINVRWLQLEEKEFRLLRNQSLVEWQRSRSDGKGVRREFTGIVQEFVEYAKGQGSQSAQKYYMQLSKMENQALFMIDKAVGDGFRDRLESSQLILLAMAEIVAQRALSEGMNAGWHYKEIYQHAKKEVEKMAAVTGRSVPGQSLLPGSRTPKVGFQGALHA